MGSDAREASRTIGERMVEDEVEWLGAKARELLAEYRPDGNHMPRFRDVEEFWSTEVEPKLTDFESMQQRFADRGSVPQDSVWYRNWRAAPPGQ